jgi:GT2 family glycosyltransferase
VTIHIVLPVHNRAAVTAEFAAALARQDVSNYRLLLIDDGCRDDTVERVRSLIAPDRLQVLRGDGKLWWAGALQLGYEHLLMSALADDDAVLIVNDDVGLAPDFLRQGLQLLSEHPDAAIQAVGHDRLTGAIDRGAVVDLMALRFREATPAEPANCLSTRGLLMRAAVFKASGGFRPQRLPHYLSDYEFTLRLRRLGVRLLSDDRFHATVRLELTGHAGYRRDGLGAFWSEAFSNRAKYNPRHMTWFIVMTCPAWVVPLHLARVWLHFARAALQAAFNRTAERRA